MTSDTILERRIADGAISSRIGDANLPCTRRAAKGRARPMIYFAPPRIMCSLLRQSANGHHLMIAISAEESFAKCLERGRICRVHMSKVELAGHIYDLSSRFRSAAATRTTQGRRALSAPTPESLACVLWILPRYLAAHSRLGTYILISTQSDAEEHVTTSFPVLKVTVGPITGLGTRHTALA